MNSSHPAELAGCPPWLLVQPYLAAAGHPVTGETLAQAAAVVASSLANSPARQPVELLRAVLQQAGVKGVQALQLGWRRFDLRRLPALVRQGEDWYLAEGRADAETGDGAILLKAVSGQTRVCDEAELADALVLWVRPQVSRGAVASGLLANNPGLKMVWTALFRQTGWVGRVMLATVIVNLLAVATSIFAMQVYDRVVPTMAYATLTTLVAGMGLIVILDWVLKTLRARIMDSLAVAVDKEVSQQVFEHLLHLRLDLQPRSLGTLAAQVGGLDAVRQFLTSSVIFGLVDLPFALVFIVFIAIIGGQVGWVYAVLLPLALLLGLLTQFRLRDLLKKQLMRSNERQGVLVDAIRGAESIRAGNGAWRFAQEWRDITASIDAYSIQQKALGNFSQVSTGSLSSIAYVAAVVVGVWQIEAGLLTMGGLIACSILGGRVIAPVAQGVQYLTQWQNVRQSLDMVNQVLRLERERLPDQQLLLPEDPPGTLSLEKVRYAYPESAVQQLNIPRLDLVAGERVLVAGPVGCGKSTLLKVLAGLYRPSEGRVRLGDADLWEVDPQLVADQVGYLPQAVHLFKGTLRSNLAFSGTAGDSRLLRITRELGVDAIAAGSAQGMDMVLSEGGDGLSGGQRQLVALARVVINQPTIWLLDEPTASLDGESEARVWRVLAENLRPEDILVVATHRPMQALGLATRVVLMRNGEILKDGSAEEVMRQVKPARATPARPAAAPVPPAIHVVASAESRHV